jgi:hypothetical protein
MKYLFEVHIKPESGSGIKARTALHRLSSGKHRVTLL